MLPGAKNIRYLSTSCGRIRRLWHLSRLGDNGHFAFASQRLPFTSSNPHPFVSLIGPIKGKRLLPRMLRHVDQKRLNLFFTLLVACYSQLDVVRDAHLLDQVEVTPEKQEAEAQNDVFFATVIPAGMSLVRTAPLRFVTRMLGLLLESGSIVIIARARVRWIILTWRS